MNKWLESYMEEQKNRSENLKKIVSSDDYINWLQNFMSDKVSINDESTIYHSDIKKSDIDNILKLELLYGAIDSYAKDNFINSREFNYGESYFIKFNNIGYEIGIMVGQCSACFCKKIEIDDSIDFIDFNDVISNKERSNRQEIIEKLKQLENLVIDLSSSVPVSTINRVTWNVYQMVKKRNA